MSEKWDMRLIRRAEHVATWSKDIVQVGAVIYDSKNRPVSEGYNGLPRNLPDEAEIYALDDRVVIHAEVNAILFAQRDLEGCTIYVSRPVCALCAALIIQAGISRVVYRITPLNLKWAEHGKVAKKMFRLAKVSVGEYN
jgi:dCMP deaminase